MAIVQLTLVNSCTPSQEERPLEEGLSSCQALTIGRRAMIGAEAVITSEMYPDDARGIW